MSLRSGRVLKDAVVVSSGDDFVNIQYTDGVAKVSYKDLTDAQQRDYRMTPEDVKARLTSGAWRTRRAGKRRKRPERRLMKKPGKSGNPCLKRSGIPVIWKERISPACFCRWGNSPRWRRKSWPCNECPGSGPRGTAEDARTFRARMGTYQEQVNAIRGRPPNSIGRIWRRNTWP
ncbi:MAG: hypothetical protein ACLT8E_08790 [Akkermansia sp.]